MDDQAERAAFEKWADLSSRQAWRHKDGKYVFADVQGQWEAWQARAAFAVALAAELVPQKWVNWYGGEMPVSPDQTVTVIMRDGTEETRSARDYRWSHYQGHIPGADTNIVMYCSTKKLEQLAEIVELAAPAATRDVPDNPADREMFAKLRGPEFSADAVHARFAAAAPDDEGDFAHYSRADLIAYIQLLRRANDAASIAD